MPFNHSTVAINSPDTLSMFLLHPKPLIWLQWTFAVLMGLIVHYVMLQMCPTSAEDALSSRIPPLTSIFTCLRGASFNNPLEFACTAKSLLWQPQPVRIRILGRDVCFLHGNANITSMLKEPSLSAVPLAAYLLRNAFKLPPLAVQLHYDETQCIQPGATPMYSQIREMNRGFLTGPEGVKMMEKFQSGLKKHMKVLEKRMTGTCVHWEDFMDFFRHDLTTVVINTWYGESLLRLTPDFLIDFWDFNDSVLGYLTPVFGILGSRKHDAREKVLLGIERWQATAQRGYNSTSENSPGRERNWGSAFFRERQTMMQGLHGYNEKAVASQELAFLYALNSNAIIATFWTALEVFRDAELLHTIRAEVEACMTSSETMKFDTKALLHQPVLQAVFAETLRLRGHGLFVRQARTDVDIHGWTLPKHSMVIASSTPAHMDPEVWCTKPLESSRPVSVFWPGRFLRTNGDAVEFNPKATENSWLPFGGGINPCPGRQFAKLQAYLTVAVLVSSIDCEVLADQSKLEMSMKNFSIGMLGPVGKIPVRVQSRIFT